MTRRPPRATRTDTLSPYTTLFRSIPEAKIAAGNYGPSNREVPAKIKVLTADLQRWARRYDVPLTFPSSFECGGWNTAAIFAARHGAAEGFVREARKSTRLNSSN